MEGSKKAEAQEGVTVKDMRGKFQERDGRLPVYRERCDSSTPLQNIEMKVLDFNTAREVIETYHYSHRLKPPSLSLGFYIENKLACAICFGQPAGKAVVSHIFGKGLESNVWELSRLFSFDDYPRNTESKCIGMALRYIESYFPNIKAIVSFADESQGHVGYIYQATNFIYLGTSGATHYYIDSNKRRFHKRYPADYKKLNKINNGMSVRDIAEKYLGLSWVDEVAGKHRYVMLLGSRKQKKDLRGRVQLKELPYPKLKGNI